MELPHEFKLKMNELLGCEYNEFIASYSETPCFGLRANPLKINAADLKELLSCGLEPVKWCAEGFYYSAAFKKNGRDAGADTFRPGKSPLYHAGVFYIQEPSAMSAAAALDIKPGHRVLDLCAAPGGKSVHAAGKLKNSGVLISNDISAGRVKALVKNIELAGITNAVVLNENPEKLARVFAGYFDRIILDAPCSGEGMFRRDPDAVKSWSKFKSEACASTQRVLLRKAAAMLSRGGLIMYSTCTYAPEENEYMIKEFLSDNADFEMAEIDYKELGISHGLFDYPGSLCGRIWPHRQRGEGHFLACLKKKGQERETPESDTQKHTPIKIGRDIKLGDISRYYEFCKESLSFTPDGKFVRHGDALYLQPDDMPPLDGIRVARSGFFLGEFKTKRFEPSQALAMGLNQKDAQKVLNFSPGSREIIKYLKGESFEVSAADGYTLICAGGFPVGWGKAVSGRLKNKYLKSWVMG